jgi:hypothetical protein
MSEEDAQDDRAGNRHLDSIITYNPLSQTLTMIGTGLELRYRWTRGGLIVELSPNDGPTYSVHGRLEGAPEELQSDRNPDLQYGRRIGASARVYLTPEALDP